MLEIKQTRQDKRVKEEGGGGERGRWEEGEETSRVNINWGKGQKND